MQAHPNVKPVALAESIGAMREQVSPRYMQQVLGTFFPGLAAYDLAGKTPV